jgi:Tfp pilus assembly protein PilZ
MVLNVSQSGMFVCSRATPKVGSKILLHFAPDSGPRSTNVTARVVWKRKVHRSAVAIRDAGIGLEVEGDCDRGAVHPGPEVWRFAPPMIGRPQPGCSRTWAVAGS